MDTIQNVPKAEIEEEEKIDIETHFLPATPVKEEDPLQRFYFSLYYDKVFRSKGTALFTSTQLLIGINFVQLCNNWICKKYLDENCNPIYL